MADNALKTPLATSLDALARGRAVDADQLGGKELPAQITQVVSSNVVKVKFLTTGPFTLPVVTIPVDSPEYGRIPHQVGDVGLVSAADYYQGGVTGFGGGQADYVQRANLTNLSFRGTGKKTLPGPAPDLNAYWLYGPNGVVLSDLDGQGNQHAVITITPASITINLSNSSGKTLTITGTTTITFDGDLHVKGNVVAGYGGSDQVGLQTHTHPDPQGGDTGAPNPGT